MTDISNQWIEAGAVDENTITLSNTGVLKAKNFAGNGTVGILQVDANNRIVFSSLPQVASDPSANNDLARKSWIDTQLSAKQSTSAKGSANGYCGLDAGAKVPVANLPSSVMEFQGAWNATTNSPQLSDAAISASKAIQDLTYTAVTAGVAGNDITIAYTTGGTAGSEVVSVVDSAISVQIEDGVSTATQVKAAVDASIPASALVAVAISGTGGDAQAIVSATNLVGGQELANTGDVYRCSVAGDASGWMTDTGPKTFAVGDLIMYSGALSKWQHSPASDSVVSVCGKTGAVVLDTDDVDESMSPTNKYFTEPRVLATVLAGLSPSAGVVANSDSLLQGFNKLAGNFATLYNHITLLAPIAGTSTVYSTIQAALNAIPAATDAASSKQTYVLFIPSGTYDEAVSYAANNRRVIIVCLGTVTMGNMTGSAWGAGGTPRNFTITNDGTATVNGVRTGIAIVGIDQVGDGFSTHQAYLNSKFRISGDLILTAAVGISSEFMFGGVEVFGNFDTSGYSGNCNVYMKNSRMRGTCGGSPLRLQRAENCQFDGLITCAVYGILDKSTIAAGMTVTTAAGDFDHQGLFNCDFTGTFTGPSTSARFDVATNYWFVKNSGALAGGATKVLLADITELVVSADPRQEVLTLSSSDISAGYVDLAVVALGSVITLFPVSGPPQEPGVDYTLSTVSNKTRITFAGSLAATLIAGNKLVATYLK